MGNKLKYVIFSYVTFLFVMSFFIIPYTDSYYYWTWSQNLQMSYVDGPPLIAYALWLSTHVFGNNLFAINIWSFLLIIGSSFIVYQITKFIDNDKSAYFASVLWLVHPFTTTRFMAISMTLDAFEVFFSLLILLITCKFIKTQRVCYIYYLGVAVGFGLLAKYNVIIFVAGLILFFAIQPSLRNIFIKPHLYLAAIISILIFSPVLIWNYQHGWSSFIYQMHSHDWTGEIGSINSADKHGLLGMWFYIKSCIFGVLHILLIVLLFLRYKLKVRLPNSIYNKLITFILWFILLFWLYKSYSAHVGLNYMVFCSALLIILLGQYLSQLRFDKVFCMSIVILIIVSIVMQLNRCFVHPKDQADYDKYIKTSLIKTSF